MRDRRDRQKDQRDDHGPEDDLAATRRREEAGAPRVDHAFRDRERLQEQADDRQLLGQLMITYEWSDWRNGNFWWIQSVYVAEEFRGRGIFRALFEHIHNLARERKDVCGVRLYMDMHNETARRTYERLGLKRTDYELFEIDFVMRAPQ